MSKYNLYIEDVSVEAVFNRLGGVEGARRLLRDEIEVVEIAPNTIFVDRSVRPNYPSWMREVMHPELELTGSDRFDTDSLQVHRIQIEGFFNGQVIYDQLKSENLLGSCLNIRDLEEIQKKGIAHFRRHFQGKEVFGWKSVLKNDSDSLTVPYLLEKRGQVIMEWRWLIADFRGFTEPLYFVSGTGI